MMSWSRRLLVPGVMSLVGVALLVGLGVWQLERMAWKRGLIATLEQRLAAEPVAAPSRAAWPTLVQSSDEFRRVRLTGVFEHEHEAFVYSLGSAGRGSSAGLGYLVFTPLRLADGARVMVNRGFVPDVRKAADTRRDGQIDGEVALVGLLRWPELRPLFAPADDPQRNLFFARDLEAIAAAKGVVVAPFYVDMESPLPPGGLPQPMPPTPKLRDNHLAYAITWFSLALSLAVVFVVWARGRGRANGRPAPSGG